MSDRPRLLLGADVGNSKTDLVLVHGDGSLLAAVRGPTASHQAVGAGPGAEVLDGLAARALATAGLDPAGRPVADLAVVCAAGADSASDERRLGRLYASRGLARRVVVRNDTHGALRAGTGAGWGAAVVCGAGINALAVAPDGREARFAALGEISGDWGGGGAVGLAALGAAVRARDGRGPRTLLERLVPARLGLRRPLDVSLALERGRLPVERLLDLAPDVFAAAAAGDGPARAILDRLGDEAATMAVAALRRVGLLRRRPPVVLAGGMFAAGDAPLLARIRAGILARAPGAEVAPLGEPPVLGAALLALDDAGSAGAAGRLRAAFRAGPRAELRAGAERTDRTAGGAVSPDREAR